MPAFVPPINAPTRLREVNSLRTVFNSSTPRAARSLPINSSSRVAPTGPTLSAWDRAARTRIAWSAGRSASNLVISSRLPSDFAAFNSSPSDIRGRATTRPSRSTSRWRFLPFIALGRLPITDRRVMVPMARN